MSASRYVVQWVDPLPDLAADWEHKRGSRRRLRHSIISDRKVARIVRKRAFA